MKVISFKVDDDVYLALRKQGVSFRSIFEPIAIKLSNHSCKNKYTGGIQKKNSTLYSDVSQIQQLATKILHGEVKQ